MKTDKQKLIDSLTELIELEKESNPRPDPALELINPDDFKDLDQEVIVELIAALKKFSERGDTAQVLTKLKEQLQADTF